MLALFSNTFSAYYSQECMLPQFPWIPPPKKKSTCVHDNDDDPFLLDTHLVSILNGTVIYETSVQPPHFCSGFYKKLSNLLQISVYI